MSWARLDDRANEHRKQLEAGAEACWLWACSLMYCNRQDARDGFIPEVMLPMLYPCIENGWQGERNGVLLQVFAGALPDNPAQGIVMVVKVPPDQMKRETTWVLAPVESGSLRITEARDNLLMLSATDGSLWSFDLTTFTLEEAK